MTKQKKIAVLLKWNRENNHTFQSRAYHARIICSADDEALDFMFDAINN